MAGALIVTAEMGAEEFAWLDSLRRRHYPAERNQLPAHLTMFHALPPSAEAELRGRLAAIASERPPHAMIAGLMDLGSGVAFRIVSDELDRIRDRVAGDLHGLLGAQDSGGWRPHVTVQNKVTPKLSRALMSEMETNFRTRPLPITGLSLHRYLGGAWERLATYAFRGR
jgi:hypothetical protein